MGQNGRSAGNPWKLNEGAYFVRGLSVGGSCSVMRRHLAVDDFSYNDFFDFTQSVSPSADITSPLLLHAIIVIHTIFVPTRLLFCVLIFLYLVLRGAGTAAQ